MYYYIILTEKCNSRCKYCYEKSMQEFENGLETKWNFDDTPVDSSVSVDELKKLLKPFDTLIFYGGEPLVNLEKLKEIMDHVNCRFCMQTNAKLLSELPWKYLKRIEKMLVSIDGTKERTNFNKGVGTYDLVIKNVRALREKGYSGEIVARMVVSGFPDIYEQIQYLISLNLFDSYHWQIDAGFYKFDYSFDDFSKFVKEYNSSIDRLLDWWFSEINSGHVVKLYPFIGLLNRLRGWDKETRLQCGAGYSNFTITTNGNLSACPIMNSVKNFYCGDVSSGINREVNVSGCSSCSVKNICGGRCLYWRSAGLWPSDGDLLICSTIKHLIKGLRRRTEGLKLDKEKFIYEKYFGPEIVP